MEPVGVLEKFSTGQFHLVAGRQRAVSPGQDAEALVARVKPDVDRRLQQCGLDAAGREGCAEATARASSSVPRGYAERS